MNADGTMKGELGVPSGSREPDEGSGPEPAPVRVPAHMKDGHSSRMRSLGAALGLAGGPAAAYGHGWAGTGDARVHVWFIACAVAAVLGLLTLSMFYPPRPDGEPEPLVPEGPGWGFGALFGFAVGLVAGCLSAFPMGAVMGGFGGAIGAAVGGLVWRRVGVLPTAIVSPAVGLMVLWLWTR